MINVARPPLKVVAVHAPKQFSALDRYQDVVDYGVWILKQPLTAMDLLKAYLEMGWPHSTIVRFALAG